MLSCLRVDKAIVYIFIDCSNSANLVRSLFSSTSSHVHSSLLIWAYNVLSSCLIEDVWKRGIPSLSPNHSTPNGCMSGITCSVSSVSSSWLGSPVREEEKEEKEEEEEEEEEKEEEEEEEEAEEKGGRRCTW